MDVCDFYSGVFWPARMAKKERISNYLMKRLNRTPTNLEIKIFTGTFTIERRFSRSPA